MHDEMQESWDLFGQPGAGGSATHPDLGTQLPLVFASQLATLSSALGYRRDEEGYNGLSDSSGCLGPIISPLCWIWKLLWWMPLDDVIFRAMLHALIPGT